MMNREQDLRTALHKAVSKALHNNQFADGWPEMVDPVVDAVLALAAPPRPVDAERVEDEDALCLRSARMFIGWPTAFKDRLDKADTNEALIACSEELAGFLKRHRDMARTSPAHSPDKAVTREGVETVTLPASDYSTLVAALEADDTFVTCEICGAWLTSEENSHGADINACWARAVEGGDKASCRSYRAFPAHSPDKAVTREGVDVYLARQMEWSARAFGNRSSAVGLTKHIEKECAEVRANPHDLTEWTDIIILALDGYWRHGGTPETIMPDLLTKQTKNMARQWPVNENPDEPNEHDRSGEALAPEPDSTGQGDGTSQEAWQPIADLKPQTNAVLGRWARSGDNEDGSEFWYWQEATGRWFEHAGEVHWFLRSGRFDHGPFYGEAPTHFHVIPEKPARVEAQTQEGGRE